MLQPNLKQDRGEKGIKSKGGSQGLCRNVLDYIKSVGNDDPGYKTSCHKSHNVL